MPSFFCTQLFYLVILVARIFEIFPEFLLAFGASFSGLKHNLRHTPPLGACAWEMCVKGGK